MEKTKYLDIRTTASPGRPLPQAADHEKALLGSMLHGAGRVISELLQKGFGEEFFHHPAHVLIFRRLVQMWNARTPIELISLTTALEESGDLAHVGGPGAVTELYTIVPTAANWRYYADTVREKWVARQAILIGESLVSAAYDPAYESEIPQMVQTALVRIAGLYESKAKTVKLSEILAEYVDYIDAVQRNEIPQGLMTGIPALDTVLRGLQPGQMVTIAAQTKRGKTTLAMNIAESVARCGAAVGIFSLEMNRRELAAKFIKAKSLVDLKVAAERPLSDLETADVMTAVAELSRLNIFVRDENIVTNTEFRAAARKLATQDQCKLLIVDYVQLFTPDANEQNRERQVADSSRTIKTTAQEMGIPIIVLSQLNETDRSRESRAIEHDSDVFIIIEEHPVLDENKKTIINPEGTEQTQHYLWIKYTRDSSNGRVPVVFDKRNGRFFEG
jgi:replicative DNA helicase